MKLRLIFVIVSLVILPLQVAFAADPVATNPANGSALTLPPYLQVLSADAMAVRWQTRERAFGWIEFGERGSTGRAVFASVDGLRVANVTEHRVVIGGLRPGTTYWYRAAFKPIVSFAAYKVVYGEEQRTPALEFRTLPDSRQTVTAVIFNDLHNDAVTFGELRRSVGDKPWDFTMFNGDCIADPGTASMALGPIHAFTEGSGAGTRPAFFLRGNHETRGAFARELPRFLDWPGGRPFFAFSAGPVRWIVLDCGEDKTDDTPVYAGLVDFDGFRREQTKWLKSELRSPEFRRATWRILVHHIPVHSSREKGGFSEPCRSLWGPLLAKARIDLALNGHTHVRAFHPEGTIGNPYPVVIGGGPKLKEATVMVMEVDRKRLHLRVLDTAGSDVFPPFEKRR